MSTFPILQFPKKLLRKTLAHVSFLDRVQLASCSQRMGERIKEIEFTVDRFHVKVYDDGQYIEVLMESATSIPRVYLKTDTLQMESVRTDIIGLLEWMHNIFPAGSFGFTLTLDVLGPGALERLLETPIFVNSSYVKLSGDVEISTNTMNLMIESLYPDLLALHVLNPIENGFNNKKLKAFSFRAVSYQEARWVEIEDIMNVRDADTLFLGFTNFTSRDMNQFLRLWSRTEHEIVRNLRLKLKAPVTIFELLTDVAALKVSHMHYVIKSEMTKPNYIALVAVRNTNFEFKSYTQIEAIDKLKRTCLIAIGNLNRKKKIGAQLEKKINRKDAWVDEFTSERCTESKEKELIHKIHLIDADIRLLDTLQREVTKHLMNDRVKIIANFPHAKLLIGQC
ncbi:unnamed protein product [Caenorhabditis sp. 36 PRJEB53466]|nr:unnamed protein product [Caenorhabditis sp. 36 PRJEB53466]